MSILLICRLLSYLFNQLTLNTFRKLFSKASAFSLANVAKLYQNPHKGQRYFVTPNTKLLL